MLVTLLCLSLLYSSVYSQCQIGSTEITICVSQFTQVLTTVDYGNTVLVCNTFYQYMGCLTFAVAKCPPILQYWVPQAKLLIESISQYCGYFIVPPHVPLRRLLGYGDPHYYKFDGTLITCDQVGYFTLASFAFGSINVYHVKSNNGVIIRAVDLLILHPNNYRTINLDVSNFTKTFDYTQNNITVKGFNGTINFFNVFKIQLSYNDGFNIQGYFPEASGGILVDGCNTTAVRVTDYAKSVCKNIADTSFRASCEYDVTVTNKTSYVSSSLDAYNYKQSNPDSIYLDGTNAASSPRFSSLYICVLLWSWMLFLLRK